MSTQYPGGFITKSPVAPTTTAASGIWTVDQALQYVKAGTWPSPPIYVEDVFSTWLYTGTGASQTITNGVNLSDSGGLVWMKNRTNSTTNSLYDTARGATSQLISEYTSAQSTQATGLTAFNSNGFTIGALANVNTSTDLFTSWTFRKQPKFFDIVTYTGTGVARTISHSLNATPGFMLVKRTDAISNWACVFGSGGNQYMAFNDGTSVNTTDATVWNGANATSSVFPVGTSTLTNASGGTYVAYLFAASSSGGFGLTGSDSIVAVGQEGSVSGLATITLGWEPQWILCKWQLSSSGGFYIYDAMRGLSVYTKTQILKASSSNAEVTSSAIMCYPTATGFELNASGSGVTNQQVNYLAIRRGPMKTPTSGTSVFLPTLTSAASGTSLTVGFPADMTWVKNLTTGIGEGTWVNDRLRGYANSPSSSASSTGLSPALNTSDTSAETASQYPLVYKVYNTTELVGSYFGGKEVVNYNFGRAPGFFDVVCYTGNGSSLKTVTHNLTVSPELIIVKNRNRSPSVNWQVYNATVGATKFMILNGVTSPLTSSTRWNNTTPTSSNFTVGSAPEVNGTGDNLVAYLFATCAGVSKVGSYTGTAALQTVNCDFTSGARFVLIKRTDTDGDWYVWDSARGISSSTDPYYLVNSAALQVTGTNYVDTTSTGFQVTAAASTTVNISAATYIFLAIA